MLIGILFVANFHTSNIIAVLHSIQQKEVFAELVRLEKIDNSNNYRLDFDALFYTVLAMTKAEMNTPNVQHGLYPLTRLAEDIGHDRNLFRRKMKNGIQITNVQADDMIKELKKASLRAPEFSKFAEDLLDKIIVRNGENVKDDYIKYYWDFLYEIQSIELLKITLGLDIWGLKFLVDAELKGDKYKMDIERHHLEKIKALFTVFKFKSDDFTEQMIPYEDFIPVLAPLMHQGHNILDKASGFNYFTQVAIHRLLHLYELIQLPLERRHELAKEFNTKTVKIKDGELVKTVRIWEKLSPNAIDKWIEQWTKVKTHGYEAFFMDSKDGYSNFYKFRYMPIKEDFSLWLNGKPPKNPKLFLSERKRDKFWQWFVSVYLHENIYPII